MTRTHGISLLITILAGGMFTRFSRAAEVTELAFLPGTIWDVDEERILWSNEEGIWIDRYAQRESELVIARRGGVDVEQGHLTPQGFLYVGNSTSDNFQRLFNVSPSGFTNLGVLGSSSIDVDGKYVIFNRFLSSGQPLVIFDTTSDEETLISPDAGNNNNDVSADGVVAYWTGIRPGGPGGQTSYDYNIFRWQNSESTRLTDDSDSLNLYPRTDGNLVVYAKNAPCCSDTASQLYLYDPREGEIPLTEVSIVGWSPDREYRINNGWIAYVDTRVELVVTPIDSYYQLASSHVWLRSPAGESVELLPSDDHITLKGLAPNGQVMFQTDFDMYLAGLDASADGIPFLDLVDPAIFNNPVTYDARFAGDQWLLFGGGMVWAVDSVYGVPSPLPGDYDASGSVDQRDLDFVLLAWGRPADEVPPEWTSNLPSGLIDQDELDPVLLNWGATTGGNNAHSAAVPSPSSGALLAITLTSGVLFRWTSRRRASCQLARNRPRAGTSPGWPLQPQCERSWQLRLRTAFLAVSALVPLSHAGAAEILWLGGADTSWQNAQNWSPVTEGDPPLPVQRIPREGDSVVVSDSTHGALVQLNANTPALASLLVADGMQLKNNVFQFHVEDAAGGVTTVRGPGTTLTLRDALPHDVIPELWTDHLIVEDGGSVLLDDALAAMHTQLTLHPGGRLGGVGQVEPGRADTPPGTVVLDNNGTLYLEVVQTTQPYLTITASGGGVLDLDGSGEDGMLLVDDGRAEASGMIVNSPLADPFSGTIRIGEADYLQFPSDVSFHNATVELSTTSPDSTADLQVGLFGYEYVELRQLTVEGADTLFTVPAGHGRIQANVEFKEGRLDVDDTLTLAGTMNFGPGFHVDLNDAKQVSFGQAVINQSVIDLDGDSEDLVLSAGGLTLNVQSIDDNGTNVFNGKLIGGLTVNVPGGWEIDGEFIASGGLSGSPVTIDDATVRVRGSDFGIFNMDAVFTENARVIMEGGISFLRSNVVINGGVWAAEDGARSGSVDFDGIVTIDGPTTMRLHNVNVRPAINHVTQIIINQPLMIETDEVEFRNSGGRTRETIEIGPEGQLRMVVRDADFVPWNVTHAIVLRGPEDGRFSDHLSGSDLRVLSGATVSGASAWSARVGIESGITIEEGATLRLDGGGSRLGTTNQIAGGQILGPGTLAASSGNGLAGAGQIETAIAFDATDSILAAEGGTLTVAGAVESIQTIAAAGGTLVLEGPWQAGDVQRVLLTNGTIRAGELPLGGELTVSTGASTLDARDLRFRAASVSQLGGGLTLRGNAAIESGAQFTGASRLTLAEAGTLALADGAQIGTDLVNSGTLTLGEPNDPLAAADLKSFRQNSTGVLQIDLAGSAEGQFDRLFSIESPNLGGELRVFLLSGFQPAPGDSFTILEAASSIVGQFATVHLPALRPGLEWLLDYAPQRLTLAATGTLETLPGDYDASGSVDQRDLDFVLLAWGAPADQAPAEWTSNLPTGLIDQDELDPVLLNWGSTADGAIAQAAGVPEPATHCSACTLILALLVATFRKRGIGS